MSVNGKKRNLKPLLALDVLSCEKHAWDHDSDQCL